MENKKYENFGADFICAMGDELRAQLETVSYSTKEKTKCELEAYKEAAEQIRTLESDPMVRLALHEKELLELLERQIERLQELQRLKRLGALLAELGWEVPEE